MEYPLTYKKFVAALKLGRLMGLCCKSCRSITVPPRMACLQCGQTEFDVVELSGRGEIETFTIIRVTPEPFIGPRVVSMVKLVEGPRLLGNLVNLGLGDLNLQIINREVKVGSQTMPGDYLSGGERVAITFELF